MLSQALLLVAIDDDLNECTAIIQTEETCAEQQRIEHLALLKYLKMADDAGDDDEKLEAVIVSLQNNPVVRRYRHWREISKS